jgi:hypothetical protein
MSVNSDLRTLNDSSLDGDGSNLQERDDVK